MELKKTEEMIILVEWVSDVYSPEIMSKLVDQATNNEFMKCQPSNKKGGKQLLLQIEPQRPMKRIKYMKVQSMDGRWLGMMENGKVVTLEESFVHQYFGKRFVNECKRMENNRFVGIPIGLTRSSVMTMMM